MDKRKVGARLPDTLPKDPAPRVTIRIAPRHQKAWADLLARHPGRSNSEVIGRAIEVALTDAQRGDIKTEPRT